MSEKTVQLTLNELHSGQLEVLERARRFNVICCGRRWGKTTLAQDLIVGQGEYSSLEGAPVAYFAPTYKMLSETWREVQSILEPVTDFKSEAEKRIQLFGGGLIDFWSLDSPDSVRGRKYKRAILDEAAMVLNLQSVWQKVIRPTLTDMRGDAWFLSTPRGKNNYFYDLAQNADIFDDWTFSQHPTQDNPFIDPAEIEDARLQLDPLTFAQEYLASFVTENLNAWAYAFDPAKHIGTTELQPRHEVYLSFDFNRDPITCFVAQHQGEKIRGIEQIKLKNSDIYKLCDYILASYTNCMFVVTGDATGRASSALVKDSLNYYTVIKSKLNLSNGQIKVTLTNPKVEENRVLVNSVFHSMDVILDKNKCKSLIFDLEHASMLPDGSLDKTDRKDVTKQLDALDCWRYYCNTFHKHILKN